MMTEDDIYQLIVKNLATYDSLLEQLQASFEEGYHQLSRANYHNKNTLRGSYGKDYWDETYTGNRYISINDKHSVSETEEPLHIANDEEIIPEKDEETNENLKKRKQREKLLAKVKKDPIYMFGGALSIPSSLKQCQLSFKASMPVLYQLLELRRTLNGLLDALGTLSNSA